MVAVLSFACNALPCIRLGRDNAEVCSSAFVIETRRQREIIKKRRRQIGFPCFPLQWTDPKSGEVSSGYRESGYLPQAVVNMLALLGWNPGTEQEIFSLEELAEVFSIDRISKHGARFDLEKAKWFNHQYLQKLDDKVLTQQFMLDLKARGIDKEEVFVERVVKLIKERCSFAKELWDNGDYFSLLLRYMPKKL